jgi:hypothetical protein
VHKLCGSSAIQSTIKTTQGRKLVQITRKILQSGFIQQHLNLLGENIIENITSTFPVFGPAEL